MREKWARRIVFFTGLMVLLLAIVFARIQNPVQPSDIIKSSPTELVESVVLEPERIEAGRQIYKQQTCAHCHSIAGEGNPRIPLDGVGTKHTDEELRNWIIGADALKGVVPESVRNMKQAYRELSNDDLNALVIYMQSLLP